MLYEIYRTSKTVETESRLMIGRDWGKGLVESGCLNKYGVFFWGDEDVLELEIGTGCTTL